MKKLKPSHLTAADKKRFYSKIDWTKVKDKENDCWEWGARMTTGGYGQFWVNGNERAHAVSFVMHHHKVVPDGMVIRHKCDNRRCVNPNHLELGTQLENMADMVQRGRQKTNVLSEEDVYEILDEHHRGKSAYKIAATRRLGTSTVNAILHGRSWKHVKERWDADQNAEPARTAGTG